jgi:hypothetical protein
MGYGNAADHFRAYIDSLLPLADRIERLAPSAAGATMPNPEYPWQSARADQIVAPVEYNFPEFSPKDANMTKFMSFIQQILMIVS